MRDTYYQSSENPVQESRLPLTWPTIRLLSPIAADSRILGEACIAILIMAVTTFLTLAIYRPGGIPWFEPFDAIFCWPTLVGAAALAAWKRSTKPLCHPLCAAALVVACFSSSTPPLVQIGLLSGFAGLLLYVFGQHWVELATASPMSRDIANLVRSRCRHQLLFWAVILAIVIAGFLATQSPVCRIAMIVLPLAAISMPPPQKLRTNRYRLACQALFSWFTYEPRRLPGLAQPPIALTRQRLMLLVVGCIVTSLALNYDANFPLISTTLAFVKQTVPERSVETPSLGIVLLAMIAGGLYIVGGPSVIMLAILTSAAMPVLLDAAAERDAAQSQGGTDQQVEADLRSSPDRTERNSLLLGCVVADGSPVLMPREVYLEHGHALGDSGGGKTSLCLCPTIEQLASFADCSIVVLDLKADSLELLASLQAAADAVGRRTGRPLPLKFFSNQRTHSTFAFNPMKQPFWRNFDLLTQTDILCAANGLTYGTDYGAGYFSSANAAILFQTLKTYPNVTTFVDLAECIGTVMTVAKKKDLHPEIRKAGVHVQEVIKRLAACEALNVTESSGRSAPVVEQAINLTDLFREPQLLYCHLPATLSPSGAPEIGRLFTYMLLAASTQTERRCPVFLVIDEFQRMVANNLEYMLQLARSMGVGVLIANQSMQDLRKGNVDLVPAIEANCRLRQWFSVSSADDQKRLIESSGLTVETLLSSSESVNSEGKSSSSCSALEHIAPRLTINDILLMNDHPFQSILKVSRGAGYAQFGGMPVIIQSQYHISKEEYQRRKAMPWPTAEGAFLPCAHMPSAPPTAMNAPGTQPGFSWSEEVIGGKDNPPLTKAGEQDLNSLFDALRGDIEQPPRRRRKGKDK